MASLIRSELIGKHAEVIDSKNKSYIGIKGTILNETKNLLEIDNKKVLKSLITIKIDGQIINGKDIFARPYDRIKILKVNKGK